MNIKLSLKNLKNKLNYIKEIKNPNLVEINNLYLCEVKMLSSFKPISLINFSYQFSSVKFILAKKNNNEFEDIFTSKIYKSENNITADIGTFFVTGISKINSKSQFIDKEKLNTYLLNKKLELTKDKLIKHSGNIEKYNCGNDEICDTCYICGNIEYENSLVDISNLPVCINCYNKFKTNNVKKKIKTL